MELKCPINHICIQATWYATLKEDKEMNSGRGLSPFESPKDEQEWKALSKTRKAYVMGAKIDDPRLHLSFVLGKKQNKVPSHSSSC